MPCDVVRTILRFILESVTTDHLKNLQNVHVSEKPSNKETKWFVQHGSKRQPGYFNVLKKCSGQYFFYFFVTWTWPAQARTCPGHAEGCV